MSADSLSEELSPLGWLAARLDLAAHVVMLSTVSLLKQPGLLPLLIMDTGLSG